MRYKKFWHLKSWQSFAAKQQPFYSDLEKKTQVLAKLAHMPALVGSKRIKKLRSELRKIALRDAFLLQAGDCAERLIDCDKKTLFKKSSLLKNMGQTLSLGLHKPVILLGRIAGQFAKPRSHAHEYKNGKHLPIFRGEAVNSNEWSLEKRCSDPKRLLWAYDSMQKSLEHLSGLDLYTSHEGLLLDFEQALTKRVDFAGDYFDLSAHMLWIGDRTCSLESAHVEFFRGVENPIGIKVGPHSSPDEIVEIIKKLNPQNDLGRVLVITRFGEAQVSSLLPALIEKVLSANLAVIWVCDPMHGNTKSLPNGRKTRFIEDINKEIDDSFLVHLQMGTYLGGLHLESTVERVSECFTQNIRCLDSNFNHVYTSLCDPRLNFAQSLEVCTYFASLYQKKTNQEACHFVESLLSFHSS